MAEQEPVQITESYWYGVQESSPALPAEGFGLHIATRPAEGAQGPTVALFAAARVPGRYAIQFGGRLPGATQIVAVDAATGQLYHRPPDSIDAVPVVVHEPTAEDPDIDSAETYFNVDLGQHLALPPDEGSYHVFCWLDELVSALETVDLPDSPDRLGGAAPVPKLHSGVRFDAPPDDLPVPPSTIVLSGPLEDRSATPPRLTVQGRIDPALLQAAADADGSTLLSLFALGHRTRRFGRITTDGAEDPTWIDHGGFTFDPFQIVSRAIEPESFFVLATFGSKRSNVLTLDRTLVAGSR